MFRDAIQFVTNVMAEDRGKTVWLFPGLKELRYLIPFRPPSEIAEYVRTLK